MTIDESRSTRSEHEAGMLASLLEEFAGLKAQVQAQQAQLQQQTQRLAQQEAELGTLRQIAADVITQEVAADAKHELVVPGRPAPPQSSRRGLLTGAAAAFGALGLAGFTASSVSAQTNPPASKSAGATGGPLLIGGTNAATTTAVGDATVLQNPASPPSTLLHWARNYPTGSVPANPTAGQKISVLGDSNYPAGNAALLASDTHIGVYGRATTGLGVVAEGNWPFQIVPSTAGAAPPINNSIVGNAPPIGTFFYQRGTFHPGLIGFFDPDALWVNWGNSSTLLLLGATNYRRIAAQDSVGVLVSVSPPIRVVDTRATAGTVVTTGYDGATGTPISAAQFAAGDVTRTFRIAGKGFPNAAPTFTFPATDTVRGVLFNLTRVQASGGGGFTTVFQAGTTAPNASTLNPTTFISYNSGFTAIGIGGAEAGNVAVRSIGDQAHDIIIDIQGYFY